MMKFDGIMEFAAQTKQYMVYGVSLAYPFFSLVTFLGVIKIAFNIPPEMAAIVAFIGVYVTGVLAFKSGLYSKDMNISWKNTPMAVDINDNTKDIKKCSNDIKESIDRIEGHLGTKK